MCVSIISPSEHEERAAGAAAGGCATSQLLRLLPPPPVCVWGAGHSAPAQALAARTIFILRRGRRAPAPVPHPCSSPQHHSHPAASRFIFIMANMVDASDVHLGEGNEARRAVPWADRTARGVCACRGFEPAVSLRSDHLSAPSATSLTGSLGWENCFQPPRPGWPLLGAPCLGFSTVTPELGVGAQAAPPSQTRGAPRCGTHRVAFHSLNNGC